MTNNLNSDVQDSRQNNISSWKKIILRYQKSSIPRATWQLINTLVPYIAVWIAIYYCKEISWWLVIPLVILAAGLMIRLFIFFHDCGHGSYFQSRKANDVLGFILGVITFTPYYHWRWEHAIHHAGSGDLNKRGTGDIWMMTVQEYLDSSRWKKFVYRVSRNPIVLFVIAPPLLFLIWQRIPNPRAPKREKLSVHYTNLCLIFFVGTFVYIFGWQSYLIIQLALSAIGGSIGVWLFYVQHQFEDVYWERGGNWDYAQAALQGSSFYKLPKVLQWFSGNIGFHHIHHLSSRIPNYHLEKCHKADPLFQSVKPVTLLASRKSFNFRFWDEQKRQLVGYRHLRAVRKSAHAQILQ